METWISLYRKFMEWQWYKDVNTKTVFLHLLLQANHRPKKWLDIIVQRGQKATSIGAIAEETGLTVQNVRTSLKKLKSTNEITIKATSKYTLITIVKYDIYQNNNNQLTNTLTNDLTINQQTTNKQLTTNNNNNKEINNINNYVCNSEDEKIKKRVVRESK